MENTGSRKTKGGRKGGVTNALLWRVTTLRSKQNIVTSAWQNCHKTKDQRPAGENRLWSSGRVETEAVVPILLFSLFSICQIFYKPLPFFFATVKTLEQDAFFKCYTIFTLGARSFLREEPRSAISEARSKRWRAKIDKRRWRKPLVARDSRLILPRQ